jgi:hypothetical protein
MSRRNRLSIAAGITCLVVTMAASPAQAAGTSSASHSNWWTLIATWAQSLVGTTVETDFGNSGPQIDPNGSGRLSSDTGHSDVGPHIDPDGGNRTTLDAGQSDIGHRIDPDGKY